MPKVFSKNRLFNLIPCQIIVFCFFALNIQANNTISCHQNINVSLNLECQSMLSASDILTVPPSPAEPHILILTTPNGETIANNLVTIENLWTTITAKVINSTTGNSCWGSINIEDKLAPVISCQDVMVQCADAGTFLPTHSDNCSTSSLEMIDEDVNPNSCDLNVIKTIVRTWVATDGFGNKSEPCIQNIFLERLDFSQIIFPSDLEVLTNSNLTCTNVQFDKNGFPSIETTGVPSIEGIPLFPLSDIYCNIGIDYEDFLIDEGNCVQKYMRTWRIYESLCSNALDNGGTSNFMVVPQSIEVADTEIPTIICPPSKTVSTFGNNECSGIATLDLPQFTDDCSSLVELDISFDGPFLDNVISEPSVELNIGVNEVIYTIYDACERSASCTTTVFVEDLTGPLAACDDSKIVSLRSSGTAFAPVSSFDNGSNDDCAFYKSIIKKETQSCDCVLPEFDDMDYIGEREGKYYYLSSVKRFGFEAFSFSSALGGNLVVTETEGEHNWLSDEVENIRSGGFLIGLKEKLNDGQFFWSDHSSPSFTKWETGQPSGVGSYVIVNEDGLWESFEGDINRAYFVTEFDNICGFSDFVHFCCSDAMEDPTLTVRAIDRFGRFNDCTITVEIQDKVAPVISCPPSVFLDCSTAVDFSNLDIYGTATATDECLMDAVISTFVENVSDCGVGEIIRTFIASDPTGQSSCQQVITLSQNITTLEAPIIWPEDYTSFSGCGTDDLSPENLPIKNAFPDFNGAACSSLMASFSDDVFSFAQSGSEACKKILRNWVVVDHCLEGTTGYVPHTFQQTIKVINSEGPTIESGCQDVVVATDNCLDAKVEILAFATDDCTEPENLRSQILVDFNSDGNGAFDTEAFGFDNEIKDSILFTIGTHFVLLDFIDDCGNSTTCTKRVTVENNIPPQAACVSGLTSMIQEMDTNGDGVPDSNMVMLFAHMLDKSNSSLGTQGSFHPCGLEFSLSFSNNANDTIAIFDCSNLNISNSLTLWVTDKAGNSDVCTTTIIIEDEDDICGLMTSNSHDVVGGIFTENAEPIENVEVIMKGSDTPIIMTGSDGIFAFENMQTGNYYSVSPIKNDDHLNGVSTLDLVKIQRHILGLQKLDSPYKMIAADVDYSGSITAIDLIELRKLILGVQTEFKNSNSWRIIDGHFQFTDDQNPLINVYPQSYDIFNLENSMDLSFVGVKIGDVDNSARSNSIQKLGKRSNLNDAIKLTIEEEKNENENTTSLLFKLNEVNNLDGFQLALDFDRSSIEVLGFKPRIDGMNINNVNSELIGKGDLRISWNSLNYNIEEGSALFELVVRPKNNYSPNEAIEIAYEIMMPEIYIDNETLPMTIDFETSDFVESEKIKLIQNIPNPWAEYTQINFYTDVIRDFQFNLFDVNGKVIYKQIKQSQKGINIIEIDRSMVNQAGVLFYEIIMDDERKMDKMILLN